MVRTRQSIGSIRTTMVKSFEPRKVSRSLCATPKRWVELSALIFIFLQSDILPFSSDPQAHASLTRSVCDHIFTKVLRLLGGIKTKKASRHIVTYPTHVVLTSKPRHRKKKSSGTVRLCKKVPHSERTSVSERPSSRAPVDFFSLFFSRVFLTASCSTTNYPSSSSCDTSPYYSPPHPHCLSLHIPLLYLLSRLLRQHLPRKPPLCSFLLSHFSLSLVSLHLYSVPISGTPRSPLVDKP